MGTEITTRLEREALRRLQEVGVELAGELQLDPLLESILRVATALLNATHSHLYRYDPDRDALISWIPLRLPQAVVAVELARGEDAAGTVLATGSALRVDDYDGWPGRTSKWPRGVTGPAVQVPVRYLSDFLAVLTVGRRPGDPAFTESDQELLELFANQAAAAIKNARLYEEARRSAEELSKLYETSLEVARELDVERVLAAILDRATGLLGARSANLRVYRPEQGLLVPLVPFQQFGQISKITLAPGEGASGRAFSTGGPVVVNEHDQWEGRSPQYPPGLMARVMAVPLRHGEQVIGALAVDRVAQRPPFGEPDVRLLSLFANQAAIAIVNAQLYAEASRSSREFHYLYDTSLDITATLDVKKVLEAVVRRTTELVEARQGEVVVYDAGTGLITDFLNLGLAEAGLPTNIHEVGEAPSGLDGLVIQSGKAIRVEDYDRWPDRLPQSAIGLIGPMIGVPIAHQGRVLGSLSLARASGERPFSDEDERRLTLFANQAAVAIQNARQVEELQRLHEERIASERLNSQLQMAKAVQAGLLPRQVPELAGWDLAVGWRPALQIGGDFYDFIPLEGGRWSFVLGDVADKGIPAALLMSMALSLLRTEAGRFPPVPEPREVLATVNRALVSGSRSGIFVTAVYGVLDSASQRINLSSAGHLPILVRRASTGEVEPVRVIGTALGIQAESRFQQEEIILAPGDVALLYSDGVTEAMNLDGEQFGAARLETFLRSAQADSAQAISDGLDRAIGDFVGPAEQSDDITHIVLRVRTKAEEGQPTAAA